LSRSTGFILEGYPRTADEASFLSELGLFPDVAVVLVVEDGDVIGRVLPPRLDKWKRKRDKKLARKQRMKEKATKKRVSFLFCFPCYDSSPPFCLVGLKRMCVLLAFVPSISYVITLLP